ncbi:MAG: FAD-dependent oxidoreductase [bacterium]|nr:FAD-dependent oxidoreductase [bacterium]
MRILTASVLSFVCLSSHAQTVFVEAESFTETGGWVVDQQFMDQMGSPFLLAHGLGKPVADAVATVRFPKPGTYRLWVRTRDWVAPWKVPGAPGKFQVVVDGRPVDTVFGTEGSEWHWQDGGMVAVGGSQTTVALHDLTGFAGRCDALVFSMEKGYAPPEDADSLAALRHEMLGLPDAAPDAGEFDMVIVGGGMAGTCAAVSAARLGLDVALVQDRPLLGGNNSSEVRVHLGGETNLPPYPAIGGVVRELDSGYRGNAQPAFHYDDDKKFAVVGEESRIHLFLNMHAYKVEKDGARIAAVVAKNIRTGADLRFTAPLFADCTGDGTIGYLAGADWRMGREGRDETGEGLAPEEADRMTMGASVQWYSAKRDAPTTFPRCPWAIQFNEKSVQRSKFGEWDWEVGMFHDQITEFEFIRDYAFRVIYGNWSYLKNDARVRADYANLDLDWVAYVAGKRESRRLLGDVILTQQDVEEWREFPDACVTTTWTIDLHYPNPENTKHFKGEEFRSIAEHLKIKPYPIPYRCLYSRNVNNLMMAGRDISVTHVALGTIRVMRTGGMMGEVVGMAASVARKHNTTPRGVYETHLDELKDLMREGVSELGGPAGIDPPEWLPSEDQNLARKATVSVSSYYDKEQYPATNVNDGDTDITANRRWVSERSMPQHVELTWDEPQTIDAVRVLSGYTPGGLPPKDANGVFVVQYHDGTTWKDVPKTRSAGNMRVDWHKRFAPVETQRLRLLVESGPSNTARVWEFAAYNLGTTQ